LPRSRLAVDLDERAPAYRSSANQSARHPALDPNRSAVRPTANLVRGVDLTRPERAPPRPGIGCSRTCTSRKRTPSGPKRPGGPAWPEVIKRPARFFTPPPLSASRKRANRAVRKTTVTQTDHKPSCRARKTRSPARGHNFGPPGREIPSDRSPLWALPVDQPRAADHDSPIRCCSQSSASPRRNSDDDVRPANNSTMPFKRQSVVDDPVPAAGGRPPHDDVLAKAATDLPKTIPARARAAFAKSSREARRTTSPGPETTDGHQKTEPHAGLLQRVRPPFGTNAPPGRLAATVAGWEKLAPPGLPQRPRSNAPPHELITSGRRPLNSAAHGAFFFFPPLVVARTKGKPCSSGGSSHPFARMQRIRELRGPGPLRLPVSVSPVALSLTSKRPERVHGFAVTAVKERFGGPRMHVRPQQ